MGGGGKGCFCFLGSRKGHMSHKRDALTEKTFGLYFRKIKCS